MSVDIEEQLMLLNYPELFLTPDQAALNGVWKRGKNRIRLERQISNEEASRHARFLAAEILRYFEVDISENYKEELADIYSWALTNTSTEKENSLMLSGNLWGFLYEMDDSGHLGTVLIAAGKPSVPHLSAMLDDEGLILYQGSKEATIGDEYRYRVNDFAAFYLSKIIGFHIQFYQDYEDRDREIERLKNTL